MLFIVGKWLGLKACIKSHRAGNSNVSWWSERSVSAFRIHKCSQIRRRPSLWARSHKCAKWIPRRLIMGRKRRFTGKHCWLKAHRNQAKGVINRRMVASMARQARERNESFRINSSHSLRLLSVRDLLKASMKALTARTTACKGCAFSRSGFPHLHSAIGCNDIRMLDPQSARKSLFKRPGLSDRSTLKFCQKKSAAKTRPAIFTGQPLNSRQYHQTTWIQKAP